MQILGLEKLSLVDYNSYACAVIFTGGCNFRCPFCHNSGLVENSVEKINVEDVMDFLNKRYGLLEAVCISGGEPTLQPGLVDFIKQIKQIGYKIKLDTNGTNPKVLKELIDNKLIDYVAMDIKNCFDKYKITAGIDNIELNDIKSSINILKKSIIDYEFRTTLVGELHDSESIEKMAKELDGAKRLYLQRFVNAETCFNRNLTSVAISQATKWKNILEKNIEQVSLRGYV